MSPLDTAKQLVADIERGIAPAKITIALRTALISMAQIEIQKAEASAESRGRANGIAAATSVFRNNGMCPTLEILTKLKEIE